MFELLIISIGLVLVIEGTMYFLFADRLEYFLNILKNINSQKIKIISLVVVLIGFCLIYFTFKYYRDIN